MNKIFTILITLFFAATGWAQQESQYTQFIFNKLYYNPAYAGSGGSPVATALYRNQWIGYEGAPTSQQVSFNAPLFANRVGLGMMVSNHRVGVTNFWYAKLAYTYHMKIKENTSLRFGIQGSFKNLSLDFSDPSVIIRQENDPSVMPNEQMSKNLANFGVGIYLTHKSIYFGVSVPHIYKNEFGINPGNVATAIETPHLYAMGGAMIPLAKAFHLKPSVLIKYVANAPFDLDAHLSLVYQMKLHVGASYRLGGDSNSIGESIDFLLYYQFNKIGFGVSYDYTLSEIKNHSNGSIEGVLRFDFKKERDDIANPRFFF